MDHSVFEKTLSALRAHRAARRMDMREAFAADPERFSHFSVKAMNASNAAAKTEAWNASMNK